MASQKLKDCNFNIGGSYSNVVLNLVTYFSYGRAPRAISGSSALEPSRQHQISDLLVKTEQLQRTIKGLTSELKPIPGLALEYNDLVDTLDEVADTTIPHIFRFSVDSFRYRLRERCEIGVLVEIAYMQRILDEFARKQASDSNRLAPKMRGTFILELLWYYFWCLFYAKYLALAIRKSIMASRDRIYAILFKPMVTSMANPVRCHHIDIVDFFGAQWSLPQDLCLNQQVFFSILRFKFQGGPAELVVTLKQFGVFRQDGLRPVRAIEWETVVKEGDDLQLSVLVNQLSEGVVSDTKRHKCPQCKRSDKLIYGSSQDGWVDCLRCNSTFNLTPIDLEDDPDEEVHTDQSSFDSQQGSIFRYFSIAIPKNGSNTPLMNFIKEQDDSPEVLDFADKNDYAGHPSSYPLSNPDTSHTPAEFSSHVEPAEGTLPNDVLDEPAHGKPPYDKANPDSVPQVKPSGSKKVLVKLLGNEYKERVSMGEKPWFMRPNYGPDDILIDHDNSIRGGTVAALVEKLTSQDQADDAFNDAFLMTFKSFTTVNELFNLLVARFNIRAPPNLNPKEMLDWTKLKQVVQIRVINTLESLATDESLLEKEDMHILDCIKVFAHSERHSAAKQLLVHIEQARGFTVRKTTLNRVWPTFPILPKPNRRLKLADMNAIELARQLTILESNLYMRIKPIECLLRARERRTENWDSITAVIQTSNKIADWVADTILIKEGPRRRAAAVMKFITVADHCRKMNNFSTMVAITSGLNTPPIRRLKLTWEKVNHRAMTQLAACEMFIDATKTFPKYRQVMASVTPPCIPFIGVFLTTLQLIQDRNPDMLPGGLVNFRKRQMASEVLSDIKGWQTQPFNFQAVPSIQQYIELSLQQFGDTKASSDHFWVLSLERESPGTAREDEYTRVLQASGFL